MSPLHRAVVPLALAVAWLAVPAPALLAQEEPLAAGSDGVPLPKKTKHVQPSYPAEALAQGIRGIVILDLVVNAQGKVESTNVIRSVPGLDEAAIAAARQWEYEPVRMDGNPVRIRLTVPITFSLALPQLDRQGGIPELRQGVSPAWPRGTGGGGLATAEVTLEPDGRVGVATILEGGPPWSDALLTALRTWRFAPPPEDAVTSFRVEAEFVAARGSDPGRVSLRASGLRQSDFLAEAPPPPATLEPTTAVSSPPEAAAPEAAAPEATPTEPATGRPAASESSSAEPAAAEPAAPEPATTDRATASSASPESPPSPPPAAGAEPATAPPPVEVITAPPPALPAENGVSAIRDVTLEPGVPDLARGRRPVGPPLARMNGVTGTVEVAFSVSAGGVTAVQSTSGPELLRVAADQAVASWVFRRARADRAYLVAVFEYTGDKATAVVRPQTAPAPSAAPQP